MLGIPKITIIDKRSVSKKLGLLLGPATLVSVAYIDPGNFGSNIAAGSRYGLDLLWVVWVSGLLAIFFQYIAGKIGIALRKSFLDLVREELLSRGFIGRIGLQIYFLVMVVMVLATDMAEFLGIVLGLSYILGLPLIIAMWLSVIDVFILMTLSDKRDLIEAVVGFLVGVVGLSLLYELFIVGVEPVKIIFSSLMIKETSPGELVIASSIIGSTIMPHALLLHTYLTADKTLNNQDKKRLLKRHFRETIAYLSVASIINASIQILAYYAFYKNNYFDVDMDKAYILLTPLYGSMASADFALS
ncbi:MAG: Nramp family divalent metal transporter, partial [Sulfolobales archaeon]